MFKCDKASFHSNYPLTNIRGAGTFVRVILQSTNYYSLTIIYRHLFIISREEQTFLCQTR